MSVSSTNVEKFFIDECVVLNSYSFIFCGHVSLKRVGMRSAGLMGCEAEYRIRGQQNSKEPRYFRQLLNGLRNENARWACFKSKLAPVLILNLLQ